MPAAGLHDLGYLVAGCVLASGDSRLGLGQALPAYLVVEQGKSLQQRLIVLKGENNRDWLSVSGDRDLLVGPNHFVHEGREMRFHICKRSSLHRPVF